MTKTIAEQFEEGWKNEKQTVMFAFKNAIERIEERITAIEHPVQQAGEWILRKQEDDEQVWCAWKNSLGEWKIVKCLLSLVRPTEYWMPYHEGMAKPEPPEVK